MSEVNLANYQKLSKIAKEKNVTLIAVSKTKPVDEILKIYNAGQRVFAENKVQELLPKYESLPKDIEWHLIGHLQTNKVKYIASFVDCIQSVDSFKLAIEVNKQAEKCKRVIDVMLEMFIAAETNKYGFSEEELEDLFDIGAFDALKNIRIRGLMGMATFTPNKILVKQEFKGLKHTFERIKEKYYSDKPHFNQLSMGMSGDWEQAIEEGSTMIRVGSAIFGERDYSRKF